MPVFSRIKPTQKRWVALFFLLCWVVPFLGVMGFSILAVPVTGPSGAVVVAEQTADPADRKDRKGDTVVNAESKSEEAPVAETLKPPEPPKKVATTAPAPTASSGRNTAAIDLNLLARVIYAEARGESLEGQVAVGAVLINRVASNKFPDDLWSVVFKRGEFCTVRDGQVWLEPDGTAYRAARLAKDGWDPTNGALYFYNPSKTTSAWIWSRTVTTRIGSHVFAV